MKHAKFVLGLAILVLASCYLPQNPANLDGEESEEQLSVMTDKSRNQGVYVNEDGDRFDIVSEEGPDGEVVKCVEALDIVPVGSGDGVGSKSFGGHGPIKALILGKRGDGYPGVWEVQNNDSIVPVSSNESGEKNSKAGDSCEVDWLIHGFFGWKYHIIFPFLSPDSKGGYGYIFVGYAENTRGIDFGGKWKIEEGATVAVYWRLDKKENGHYHLSRARIIGEPNENYKNWKKDKDKEFPRSYRYRHSMFVHFLRYLFANFKFFFLDSFDVYLVDVLDAHYDDTQKKYLVKGHVEGEIDTVTIGIAAIDPNGEITITIEGDNGNGNGNGGTYERIVIDVHGPSGAGDPEKIDIALYHLDNGVLTLKTRDETPKDPGFIDTEGLNLIGGTYYIEVYHENPLTTFGQAYVVRAIPLPPAPALVPGTDVPTTLPTIDGGNLDPYEISGETYSNTTAFLELDTNWVQRYLGAGADVDWIRLDLPVLP